MVCQENFEISTLGLRDRRSSSELLAHYLHKDTVLKPNFGVGCFPSLAFWLWLFQDWKEALPARLVHASMNDTQYSIYEKITFVISQFLTMSKNSGDSR